MTSSYLFECGTSAAYVTLKHFFFLSIQSSVIKLEIWVTVSLIFWSIASGEWNMSYQIHKKECRVVEVWKGKVLDAVWMA